MRQPTHTRKCSASFWFCRQDLSINRWNKTFCEWNFHSSGFIDCERTRRQTFVQICKTIKPVWSGVTNVAEKRAEDIHENHNKIKGKMNRFIHRNNKAAASQIRKYIHWSKMSRFPRFIRSVTLTPCVRKAKFCTKAPFQMPEHQKRINFCFTSQCVEDIEFVQFATLPSQGIVRYLYKLSRSPHQSSRTYIRLQ